ncbi:hypothetical protein DWX58_01555 [Pseudoflavonifractor sp. AF19-9AC]|nr:hypothetical protein DWX58_01555 [Pseudoflavonifractor sp. AF19-9AC]
MWGTGICLLFRGGFSVVPLGLSGEVGCGNFPGQIVIVGVYPIGRVGHIQELILHAPAVILAGRGEVHFQVAAVFQFVPGAVEDAFFLQAMRHRKSLG